MIPSKISRYELDEQLWLGGYGLRDPLATSARTVDELLAQERQYGYAHGLQEGRALAAGVAWVLGFGLGTAFTAAVWGVVAWLRQ